STNSIGRANLDGTNPNPRFITGAGAPSGVAVNATHIYWANQSTNSIGRANLDGSGATQSFITGVKNPGDIAVDERHIYWSGGSTNSIGRANLNGSSPNQNFIRSVVVTGTGGGLFVSTTHIYWTTSGPGTAAIGRANLDGSNANRALITGACLGPADPECFSPVDVAVDASKVYWTNPGNGRIGRANLDGAAPQPTFITGLAAPLVGIALDATRIYFASDTTIGRVNVDGTNASQSFITGTSHVTGLAVDALASPPPAAPSFGRAATMRTISGSVLIRVPGSSRFVELGSLTRIPFGSIVDARRGRVEIIAAADAAGRLQVGQFYEGEFKLGQVRGLRPAVDLKLVGGDFSGCGARTIALASAAAAKSSSRSKREVRHLWGDAKGRWRTSGKGSATTVRGTIWLVQDRCDATLTRVRRGVVSVRDKARRRTVTVSAPGSYLAPYRR
ncbi:MAG: hypothetical protein QOF55_91, partial [Thermoleophilaceae bacterium]|nr:hypothetical protein [Thermoleophilaceae bacterium]